jgi:hypothetical protein
MWNNQGILITGGSLNSNVTAVGDHAHASNQGIMNGPSTSLEDAKHSVALLVKALEETRQYIPEADQVISTAGLLRSELDKPSPNRFTLKALLEAVTGVTSSITGVAGAAEAVRKAISLLG